MILQIDTTYSTILDSLISNCWNDFQGHLRSSENTWFDRENIAFIRVQ